MKANSNLGILKLLAERGRVVAEPSGGVPLAVLMEQPSLFAGGKVVARAWCEAFVQRGASFVDPADRPETHLDDADMKEVNKTFGRRFDLVSFRWLAPGEIQSL